MNKLSLRARGLRRFLTMAAMIIVFFVSTSSATVTTYTATLDGASQSPPNPSPGTGIAQVDLDDVAHTLHLAVEFQGLVAGTTAAHIHAGTPAAAETFLFASIAAGTAYLNIHTTAYGGGEIRGFFTGGAVPLTETTCGQLKTLFR